jgi:predicted DNA-binding protein
MEYYRKSNNNKTRQSNVIQGETLQVRIDGELRQFINQLSKELDEPKSKTVRDILHNFFLDQKQQQMKADIEAMFS